MVTRGLKVMKSNRQWFSLCMPMQFNLNLPRSMAALAMLMFTGAPLQDQGKRYTGLHGVDTHGRRSLRGGAPAGLQSSGSKPYTPPYVAKRDDVGKEGHSYVSTGDYEVNQTVVHSLHDDMIRTLPSKEYGDSNDPRVNRPTSLKPR